MNPEVIEFAERCAEIHSPAPVFVMDIGYHQNNGEECFRVIEYNTFNSAGLYDCGVGNIIDSIRDMV